MSQKIDVFVVEQIKDFDSNAQQIMLEFYFSHPLLNGMVHDYLRDLKCVKRNHVILST
jgi:hypothetical protein